AAQSPADRSRASASAQAGTSSSDGWQFGDEEDQVPGWREILRGQAWDLLLFGAFIVLALVSFFRKSVRLKYIALVAAVLYLGFIKSQLISIVNVFALLEWNLPLFRSSLPWSLPAACPVISTLLW